MEMEVRSAGGKKVDAIYAGFTVRTDQPKSIGGEGSAPWPFSLFLASIVTCAGYYVFDFCEQRGISIEDIRLVLRTERNREIKMLSKISMEIQLPADFPEKYKKAVIRAADLCSVKKHIENSPAFETYVTTLAS